MQTAIFDEKGNLIRPKKTLENTSDWFETGKQKSPSKPGNVDKGCRYFLCISTPENYNICITEKLFGVEKHNKKQIEKTCPGDIIVFYIKSDMEFGMVCKIVSDVSELTKPVWSDGVYPYRVKLELEFHPQTHKRLDEFIRKDLKFITRKDEKWGCVLQKSMLELCEDDFFKIWAYLKK